MCMSGVGTLGAYAHYRASLFTQGKILGCPMGEGETNGTHFGCGQNMCIPNEKKCNGPIDCYNGRDETHCTGELFRI